VTATPSVIRVEEPIAARGHLAAKFLGSHSTRNQDGMTASWDSPQQAHTGISTSANETDMRTGTVRPRTICVCVVDCQRRNDDLRGRLPMKKPFLDGTGPVRRLESGSEGGGRRSREHLKPAGPRHRRAVLALIAIMAIIALIFRGEPGQQALQHKLPPENV